MVCQGKGQKACAAASDATQAATASGASSQNQGGQSTGRPHGPSNLPARVEAKLKQRLNDHAALWVGASWKEAIQQSLTTPDCGIEETETASGYRLFGWGNGYKKKYTRSIPPVLNTYVEQLLQKEA